MFDACRVAATAILFMLDVCLAEATAMLRMLDAYLAVVTLRMLDAYLVAATLRMLDAYLAAATPRMLDAYLVGARMSAACPAAATATLRMFDAYRVAETATLRTADETARTITNVVVVAAVVLVVDVIAVVATGTAAVAAAEALAVVAGFCLPSASPPLSTKTGTVIRVFSTVAAVEVEAATAAAREPVLVPVTANLAKRAKKCAKRLENTHEAWIVEPRTTKRLGKLHKGWRMGLRSTENVLGKPREGWEERLRAAKGRGGGCGQWRVRWRVGLRMVGEQRARGARVGVLGRRFWMLGLAVRRRGTMRRTNVVVEVEVEKVGWFLRRTGIQ